MPRKMIVTLPAGHLAASATQALETALQTVYARHLEDGRPPLVLWCELPAGQGFVAGAPAAVHMLFVEVANGLPQPQREEAMLAFAQAYAAGTGVALEQPMVTLADADTFAAYLQANRGRLRWAARLRFALGTLWHALRSRRRLGYAQLRANL